MDVDGALVPRAETLPIASVFFLKQFEEMSHSMQPQGNTRLRRSVLQRYAAGGVAASRSPKTSVGVILITGLDLLFKATGSEQ